MGHVPHLYLPRPWRSDELKLATGQVHHLTRVLRMRAGEPVSYTDGAGTSGSGTFGGEAVSRGEEQSVPRPTDLTVAVAPPRDRARTRFLVEKLAELGVARLLWVSTSRTEGKPPPLDKADSWAISALEQSRGAWRLEIGESTLTELDPDRLIVADPEGGEAPPVAAPILLVGPEGGLAPDEIPVGARKMELGPTVLRTETAAIIGAGLLRLSRDD